MKLVLRCSSGRQKCSQSTIKVGKEAKEDTHFKKVAKQALCPKL
jgi:hypothetical protein